VKPLNKYFITLAVVAFVIFLFAADANAQCSMCKKIATDGTSQKEAGNTVNYAILYLMTIPYFMILFIFRKQLVAFFRSFRTK